MAQFVNPYTFVPQVTAIERGEPSGHDALGRGNLSGFLGIKLTAKTPLLIGGYGTADRPDVPRRAHDDQPVIPGSGLLGAVRSVHEALAGGCMRVLDADRVPVHRHPASTAQTRDLTLAVVSKVKAGRPTEVQLCDPVIWVPAQLLPREEDGLPSTGDQFRYEPTPGRPGEFPSAAIERTPSRSTLRAWSETLREGVVPGSLIRIREMGPVTGDCWVLLVTDTAARDPKRTVYFACGRTGPSAARYSVPEETAWKSFLQVVEGVDDLRPEELKRAGAQSRAEPSWDPGRPGYAMVYPPAPRTRGGVVIGEKPSPIGRRLYARTHFYEGQPVWVAIDGSDRQVTEIRLSQLWRYPGGGPVGERVGEAKPCAHHRRLCWSCRLFGSADTEGREDDDLAVQQSYRGHVRVNDLIADASFTPLIWRLAPLAAPKPSAGQFYLDHSAPGRTRAAARDTPAAATWGSLADKPAARPVRGRKFYWRTDTPGEEAPPGQHARWKRRDHQSEAMGGDAALIPAGQVFRGRVAFDNLSVADLGSLIAALDPRQLQHAGGDDRAAAWGETVTSVGGGKPFGFGAVTIEIESVSAQTAGERYLGAPPAGIDPAEVVREFRGRVRGGVRSTWAALRNALTFGFIPDDLVWYPPGNGARGSQDYDKSFEFFALTNGLTLRDETRELVVLPDAAGSPGDQALDSRGKVRRHERRG